MANQKSSKWQFWIDRGGTFTDVVAYQGTKQIITYKLLSENPEHYTDASLQGIRHILNLHKNENIPFEIIKSIRMGTTVATNALLERKGERSALVITKGFRDALRIAYQNRPKIFAREIILPEMLYEEVIEVDERILANGKILNELNLKSLEPGLKDLLQKGISSVAIVLMHAYQYPDHENQVAKLCYDLGFKQISVSSEVSPLMKLVSRGDTSMVDAYLTPLLKHYIETVSKELDKKNLYFMQSNGGLASADQFKGRNSILSGPAGGVVGAVKTAEIAGIHKIIGFDMGGTSTDVSHYNGELEREFETQVAGVRMRTPMLHIHTIAAGGGSICSFDGARFRVGPESAGANPGPACYRRGGPLTVTDCNVVLGKIHSEYFPKVFGKDANQPIDTKIVKEKFSRLAKEIKTKTQIEKTMEDIAAGFISIAVENMANAIKKISIQKGYDISDYVLCGFGGAAGQHVCLVADALGIKKIMLHPLAGVLSAYGIGLADVCVIKDHSIEKLLANENLSNIESLYRKLEDQAKAEVLCQNISGANIILNRSINLRYQGTDTSLTVPYGSIGQMVENFQESHKKRFGFLAEDLNLIVDAISVEAVGKTWTETIEKNELQDAKPNKPLAQTEIYAEGTFHKAPIYDRDHLVTDQIITGPALLIEANATTVVEKGWQAILDKKGHLILTRNEALTFKKAIGTKVDPIKLEIFNNLFMSIAEQMGVTLQQTTQSVNIKERLDFSCALFDHKGGLVANAPHIPVHLGSMSDSVRSLVENIGDNLKPGGVYALNAPYNGGTHLPDVTIITPVFDDEEKEILFFVASRGHHADIGGITPGSMPPFSQTIAEEGVLIDNFCIVKQNHFCENETWELLTKGPYPARDPKRNISDFKAQIAANEKGVQEIKKMIEQFSLKTVQSYMKHVQDNASEAVRQVIDHLDDGHFLLKTDTGAQIQVKLSVDKKKREATIDFSGTSQERRDNFNAPRSICRAAVLYVFRTLVDLDIPLNEGCLKPIHLIIPEGCYLNPKYPAAVAAGNVETSQHITIALNGALNKQAASQGTMNNFTFGNEKYQYYETVCGGSGAGPDYNGTDAVQTHMTNSRLTDPEVLEFRFPIQVKDFCIRKNSGGNGKFKGGNGTIRKITFLEKMTTSILSSHREVAPFGLSGGQDGLPGRNYIQKQDGTIIPLKACDQYEVDLGDTFVMETPGGGGYGNE